MASRNGTRVIINRSKGPRNRNQLNGRTNGINGTKNGNIQDGTNNTEQSNLVRSRLGNLPSLKEFVHKQSVVSQYRGFLRAVALIPDEHWRKQARNEIRETFKAFKDEKDAVATKMAVKEGERRLKQVKSMVGYDDAKSQDHPDSWININDEEDPRGRIGIEWPWERSPNSDSSGNDGSNSSG